MQDVSANGALLPFLIEEIGDTMQWYLQGELEARAWTAQAKELSSENCKEMEVRSNCVAIMRTYRNDEYMDVTISVLQGNRRDGLYESATAL